MEQSGRQSRNRSMSDGLIFEKDSKEIQYRKKQDF
jgi:hypothetical protein